MVDNKTETGLRLDIESGDESHGQENLIFCFEVSVYILPWLFLSVGDK